MDFAAQQGVAAAQALVNRGADHMVEAPQAHPFVVQLGDALHSNALAAGGVEMRYSSVSGMLSGSLFTRDLVLLNRPIPSVVPPPQRLDALHTQMVADGMDATAAVDPKTFLAQARGWVSSLDPANIPAAALTTDAEWYGTQAAAAGAASAAANAWRRVPRIMDVSVHHGGGLYQLTYLGWVHWFSPGIFLSAQRDLPGCPYRALMDAGQARAEAAGVVNAAPALGNPMQTARAAIVGFVQTVPDAGWELAVCPDAAGVHCRTGVFADWMSLAAVHGCDAAAAASFRLTLGDNFNYFSGKLPNLLEVLRPPISASAFSGHIARMASRCFSPGKEPPSSIADVIELEAQLGHYLVSLGAQAGLITAQQRVDWLCSQPPPSLPGAIDPAGPAAAAAARRSSEAPSCAT